MIDFIWKILTAYGSILLLIMGLFLILSGLIFVLLEKRLSKLQLTGKEGFSETLRQTPFLLVVAIDMLDFVLDVFATPIVWIFLGRYNLHGLRKFSAAEAIIPGTQMIPTMTLCWIAVNIFKLTL